MSGPVPIIGGTGALGFGLAVRLARHGVPIVIGSRDAGRAADAAERVRAQVPDAHVEGLENPDAVTRGEIVVLAVPYEAHGATLAAIAPALSPGQILVDTTVPLQIEKGKAPRLADDGAGSAGRQSQDAVPEGVEVVTALHTVSGSALEDLDHELDEDVLVAGNSDDAKRRVAELIATVPGLRPVNAGRLAVARLVESLTPLLISVNRRYKTHAGIKLTNLPDELW